MTTEWMCDAVDCKYQFTTLGGFVLHPNQLWISIRRSSHKPYEAEHRDKFVAS